ncbi:MAG: hypothetical protein GF308_04105 [Candidatus Heimdallarchaeota archaeon]|nr:hypothetical protein [Candidatus Heimdallarchaeota archaeon]
MKNYSIAKAYPTIPIIFLGGIKDDRSPIYDTMGLAVTDLAENTRTETAVELLSSAGSSSADDCEISFLLEGESLQGKRGEETLETIRSFVRLADIQEPVKLNIRSNNYNIFSGSSDSGLAALFTALNDVFELGLSQKELLEYAMQGSESAGRSLYGGLTHTIVDSQLEVVQLASAEELSDLALFSIPFDYDSRLSADEIHSGIVTHEHFSERVAQIPQWVDGIKTALQAKDFIALLEVAEENIRNAHQLLEGVGLVVRKPKMMALCHLVEKMRELDILAYYLIGGGNLITLATTSKYAPDVATYLAKECWPYYPFKVAGSPKIIDSG